ncbi:MAG: hypothetical protein WCQ60_02055, partial [bacterium]
MKKELKKFLLTCPLAVATLLIPIFLGTNQLLTIALLICVSLLMIGINWSFKYIILFLLIFISGPIAEAIAIHFGAWTYATPVFIGVPI